MRTGPTKGGLRLADRQPWTRMDQWQLMRYVRMDHEWSRQRGGAPSWPCPHCRTALTVLTCTYTANQWGREEGPNIPGDLCCPHCGTSVARAHVRRLFMWDAQRWKDAREDMESDDDRDTTPETP